MYGTTYCIILEEHDKIADYGLSTNPLLEPQRDISIFHCLIGCSVSYGYDCEMAGGKYLFVGIGGVRGSV